jgi:hypothetical protein
MKLNISKALLELKLEYSQLTEKFEEEKHELTSALLSEKSEIFDLESKVRYHWVSQLVKLAASQVQELSAQTQESVQARDLMSQQLNKVSIELQALKNSYQETRANMSKEQEKNVELGAELLTLVNQVPLARNRCKHLQCHCSQRDITAIQMTDLNKQLQALQARNASIEEGMFALQREREEQKLAYQQVQSELEVTRADKIKVHECQLKHGV